MAEKIIIESEDEKEETDNSAVLNMARELGELSERYSQWQTRQLETDQTLSNLKESLSSVQSTLQSLQTEISAIVSNQTKLAQDLETLVLEEFEEISDENEEDLGAQKIETPPMPEVEEKKTSILARLFLSK